MGTGGVTWYAADSEAAAEEGVAAFEGLYGFLGGYDFGFVVEGWGGEVAVEEAVWWFG